MKIYLHWYKHYEGAGNFGDELNPYIIERLSGKSVTCSETWSGTKFNAIKSILYRMFVQRKIKGVFSSYEWNNVFNRKVIFGIGSIISCGNENVIVWGSGIINKEDRIPNSKFLAVRGKYTQGRIEELGMKAPEILGDPAMLLPLIYQPSESEKFKLGIIPHYLHFEAVKKHCYNPQVLIIDLLNPIEKVISDICSCEMTLSTSLHGIIVSHAYRIPSLWVDLEGVTDVKLAGDNIKFADYFSSVNIKEYQQVHLDNEQELLNMISKLKKNYVEFLLPEENIVTSIQKRLLEVAPFTVLKKFT